MPMSRPSRLLLPAVAALMLTAVSCASSADRPDPTAEPPLGPIKAIRTPADTALPLDAYWPTTQDNELAHRAGYLVGGDCMKRLGSVDWPVPDMGPQPQTEGRNFRRFGNFDPDTAARWGFKYPGAVAGSAQPPPTPRTRTPTPLEQQIWIGAIRQTPDGRTVPPGGCSEEADRILAGGVRPAEYRRFVQELSGRAATGSETDSRAREADARWSACMARSGYKYKNYMDPNNDAAFASESAGAKEIATARADVACRRETGLVDLLFAVEAAYQNRLIEENAEQLGAVKDYQEAMKRGASQALSGRPTS